MDLLEKFKAFVQSEDLLDGDRPTLLTVSGGVDSIVMAHLFREADCAFGVAHCNFRLRGAESDNDELFVQKLAASWNVPFFVKHFETQMYAGENDLSIQMAARKLRYDWFRQLASDNEFSRVATAHNLDDSVETALLNFVRGTGLSGLKGIAVSAMFKPAAETPGEGRLIRPLLFAARADIEAWARTRRIAWREDSSNFSDDYSRNFLRNRVMPLLEGLNPNFLQTAARNLTRLRETDENLQYLLRHFFGETKGAESEFYIDKQKLAQLPAPRRALRELLKHCGFSEEQTRQAAGNPDHIGLELCSGTGWRLLIDRGKILLGRPEDPQTSIFPLLTIQADDLMVTLPGGNRLLLMYSDTASTFPDGRQAIIVDAERLCFPLILRPWQPGDVFQPFGMAGHSQKLQDFFTNLKLSRFDKEKVLVLENGDGNIVWIVGHRLDERFKVTDETNKFLKINYL